jgi:hypothetical protein
VSYRGGCAHIYVYDTPSSKTHTGRVLTGEWVRGYAGGGAPKLTFLSLKLTFLSLKLTFLSLKLTFLSLKLTFLSIRRGGAHAPSRWLDPQSLHPPPCKTHPKGI